MQTLDSLARHFKFSVNLAWKDIPKIARDTILYGSGEEIIRMSYVDGERKYQISKPFEGVITNLDRRYRETDSSWTREEVEKYQRITACEVCSGNRLKPEALAVKLDGLHISQVTEMSIRQASRWFDALPESLTSQQQEIAARISEGNQ